MGRRRRLPWLPLIQRRLLYKPKSFPLRLARRLSGSAANMLGVVAAGIGLPAIGGRVPMAGPSGFTAAGAGVGIAGFGWVRTGVNKLTWNSGKRARDDVSGVFFYCDADVENPRKLIEGETRFQVHRAAAAWANSFKLVISHLAPSPAKDTRF